MEARERKGEEGNNLNTGSLYIDHNLRHHKWDFILCNEYLLVINWMIINEAKIRTDCNAMLFAFVVNLLNLKSLIMRSLFYTNQ